MSGTSFGRDYPTGFPVNPRNQDHCGLRCNFTIKQCLIQHIYQCYLDLKGVVHQFL